MPAAVRYMTAQTAISRVCKAMGLRVPVSASGATDSLSVQLWALLSEVGQELLGEYDWQVKIKTHTVVIQDPTLNYALPTDFEQMFNSAAWNRTSRIPLIGPLTEQQWQLLQARQLGGTTLRLQYKIEDDLLKFYWAPSDPQTIAFSYVSNGWVQDGTDPLIFKSVATADNDLILFDQRMFITKLILEWRKKKGFSTVDDQAAYDKALATAKYNDRPKNDLRTSGSSSYPYLGYLNMPDTNYGGP